MITIKEARNNYGRTGEYWYLSKHGIGPGTLPKDVNVLNTVEDGMDTYILVDGVLTTEELREYDLKEKVPPEIDTISDGMDSPAKEDAVAEVIKRLQPFVEYGYDYKLDNEDEYYDIITYAYRNGVSFGEDLDLRGSQPGIIVFVEDETFYIY